MQTTFNGQGFSQAEIRTFTPTFEGAQSRRENSRESVISRRNTRRERRANRAI